MTDPTASNGGVPELPASELPVDELPVLGPGIPEPPSKAKLAWATLAALVVAGVVLVSTVLPAEYDIDPLGIGEALGLRVLATPGSGPIPVREGAIIAARSSYRLDRMTFVLEPEGWVEYKYRPDTAATSRRFLGSTAGTGSTKPTTRSR